MSQAARKSLAAAAGFFAILFLSGGAWSAWQQRAREAWQLRIEEHSLPPKVNRIQRLPQGCHIVLEAGRPEKARVLQKMKGAKALGQPKTVKVLRKGQPAWILAGQGPPATIFIPEWGLARPALSLEATAYDPGPVTNTRGWVGTTKSGERARFGIAAVDPRVIPLGSRLYIEGYGPALAADIGGAIKGKRIDLCFNSTREARAWGRKKARVWRVDALGPKGRKAWEEALQQNGAAERL